MLKESNNSTGPLSLSASPSKDVVQMLKNKLQFTQTTLDDATRERDKLKEVNKCFYH